MYTVNKQDNSSLIKDFASAQLTETTMQNAEHFLVKCIKPSSRLETFDELRVNDFETTLKVDLEKTPCTSANARKHIKRSFYQVQLWVQAPFRDASMILNPEMYGFERVSGVLVPEMVISKPEDLPGPCKCSKCARKNSCPCRIAGVHCCKYCKCEGGSSCKNPIAPKMA